jgi:hypothetical protein
MSFDLLNQSCIFRKMRKTALSLRKTSLNVRLRTLFCYPSLVSDTNEMSTRSEDLRLGRNGLEICMRHLRQRKEPWIPTLFLLEESLCGEEVPHLSHEPLIWKNIGGRTVKSKPTEVAQIIA